MKLDQALSLVSESIHAHLRMERLLLDDHLASRQAMQDQARDTWDAQDYKDATQGDCGFPWGSDEQSEWTSVISREATFAIMHIAVNMVMALAPEEWTEATHADWVAFLEKSCTLDADAVAQFMDGWDGEFTY
jgi:hypothetical protein